MSPDFLTGKWVFTFEESLNESSDLVESAQTKFVAQGFQQVQRADYLHAFVPVVKFTSIQVFLANVALYDLENYPTDVVIAFFNGFSDNEVNMEIPHNIGHNSETGELCKLNEPLYGLKQAPLLCIEKTDLYLFLELNFKKLSG